MMNIEAYTLATQQKNAARLARPSMREAQHETIGSNRRVFLTTGLGIFLLAALGCAESSPMWKKLDGAPYPVQVSSLVTGNRSILSAHRTLTYGDWRVGFAKEAPVATAEPNCSWRFHCDVTIDPLTCITSTGQASDCSLRFDTLAEHCDLLIADAHATIQIACPVDIILAAHDKQAVTPLSAEAHASRQR